MKTSKSQFKLFKKYALDWIVEFGLSDWYVDIVHVSLDDTTIANCALGYNSQTATISFNTDNCLEVMDNNLIHEVALHEVLELLLADLGSLVEARDYSETHYERATHKIINRLSKVLLKS